MAQAFPYDLLFMDCQMPGMNGFEATAEIRKWESEKQEARSKVRGAQNDTRRIPIIAMTANAMQGDREKCLHAGMDDYITKPVNAEKLKETLERWTQETTSDEKHSSPKVKVVDVQATGPYSKATQNMNIK